MSSGPLGARWQCVLQLIGAFIPALASAQAPESKPGLHLSWVRAPEAEACVDATTVARDVERRLGWSPFESTAGPTASVETLVTRGDEHWKALIVMRRADGTTLGSREVESVAPTCDSLARASGLAIALMIETAYDDLGGTLPPPPQPPPEPAEPEPKASSHAAVEDRTAAVTADPKGPPGFGLAGGVVCATRVLPGMACGVTFRGDVEIYDPFLLSISVTFLPEQDMERSESNLSFGLTYASIGGCHRVMLNDFWSLATCAAVLAGALHVTVEDPTPVTPGQRPWLAASAALRVGWQVGGFELQTAFEALAPLARRNYVLDRVDPTPSESLFEDAALGGTGTVTAGARF